MTFYVKPNTEHCSQKQTGRPTKLNIMQTNYSVKVLIATFFGLFALLCNYEFASGNMNEGSFALVALINLIAIIFGLATLFSKK